jgi:hypothetical protein
VGYQSFSTLLFRTFHVQPVQFSQLSVKTYSNDCTKLKMIRRAFAAPEKKSLRKSGGTSKSQDTKRKSGSGNSSSYTIESELHLDDNAWIKLNVGGQPFITTRGTLIKDSSSMLAKMFGSQWNSAVDDSGAFLLDRSPEYFAVLLHYLRTNEIVMPPEVNPVGVYKEAKYFNLNSMLPALKKSVDEGSRDMTRKEFIQLLLVCPQNQSLRCQGLNLSHLDLSKLDLSRVNFKLCILKKANLSECTLDGAELTGANLCGANLTVRRLDKASVPLAHRHSLA